MIPSFHIIKKEKKSTKDGEINDVYGSVFQNVCIYTFYDHKGILHSVLHIQTNDYECINAYMRSHVNLIFAQMKRKKKTHIRKKHEILLR